MAAALRPYVASRIVQRLDPALDSALLERFDLPFAKTTEVTTARAYVPRGRGSYAET